jgi:hypothetical protein
MSQRQRFPSDGRPWFRVVVDLLDDPRFDRSNDRLASYIRLLAMLKRNRSKDGMIELSETALCMAMGVRRIDSAKLRLRYLVDTSLVRASYLQGTILIWVRKWPKVQGTAPKRPRDRDKIREDKKEIANAPHSGPKGPKRNPAINLLKKEPGSPEEKAAWLERELPLLEALAEREYPTQPRKRSAEIKSRVIRHYRQHLKGRGTPSSDEEKRLMEEATRKKHAEIEAFRKEREQLALETQ